MTDQLRRVLWEWNVATYPFERQIAAAVAGGYDTLTIPVRKYRKELAAGKTAKGMLATAAANGITLDFLDGMSSWAPVRYPDGADEFLRNALDFSVEETFAICDVLGLKSIVAIGGFTPGQLPLSQLIDSFGSFCDRAAARGLWVDLESMPMLGIPNLADAWAIVSGANRPNSGIMFDTWHFMRGKPDMELLRSIPRSRIVNVQLADGAREPRGSLWEDATRYRMFPGEGELPIVEMLRTIRRTQDIRSIGPEILSIEIDAMSPEEAGRRSAASVQTVMTQAGF
jgi:sugar phosphate isomerase/epimerase